MLKMCAFETHYYQARFKIKKRAVENFYPLSNCSEIKMQNLIGQKKVSGKKCVVFLINSQSTKRAKFFIIKILNLMKSPFDYKKKHFLTEYLHGETFHRNH